MVSPVLSKQLSAKQQSSIAAHTRRPAVFVYGSLMETEVLELLLGKSVGTADLMDAVLPGFRRCAVVDRKYPAAIPTDGGDVICGKLLHLESEHELNWLDEYEGEEYYRHQTSVVLPKTGEIVPVYVYVWVHHYTRLDDNDWDVHEFKRNLGSYLAMCEQYRLCPSS